MCRSSSPLFGALVRRFSCDELERRFHQPKASRCISCSIRLYKPSMTDAQIEEIKRHFGVVAEALRSDIRQVAEGHSGIRRELQEMRNEFRDEFMELRALIRLRSHNLMNGFPHWRPIF